MGDSIPEHNKHMHTIYRRQAKLTLLDTDLRLWAEAGMERATSEVVIRRSAVPRLGPSVI